MVRPLISVTTSLSWKEKYYLYVDILEEEGCCFKKEVSGP